MKTIRLGCTDIGAILFAGIDDDNNLCSTYISVGGDGEFTGLLTTSKAEIPPTYDHNVDLSIIILVNE